MSTQTDALIILIGSTIFCVIILLLIIYRYTFDKSYNKESGYYVMTRYSNKNEASKILHYLNVYSISLLEKMHEKYRQNKESMKLISNLVNNYDPDYLEENDPLFTFGHKAFTFKFQRIAICLRQNNGEFYDIETLKFVMMHELSHIATLEKNHNDFFWTIFKFILHAAAELVGYNPINYEFQPISYCGITVSHNPYYGEYDISKYLSVI